MVAYINIYAHVLFLNSALNYFAVNNFNLIWIVSIIYFTHYLNEPVFHSIYLTFSDRAEIEKLKKCYLDGKMYHLNEKMRPNEDGCSACLCTENFDNSTTIRENSACQRFRCLPQFRDFDDLRRGCVPVFEPIGCCAERFKCRRFKPLQFIFTMLI